MSFEVSDEPNTLWEEISVQLKLLEESLKQTSMFESAQLSMETTISQFHQSKTGATEMDASDYFASLLAIYSKDEAATKQILQLIYNVVKSLNEKKNNDVANITGKLPVKWAELLVNLIFSSRWTKTLVADALLCLKIYARIAQGSGVLLLLWHAFHDNTAKIANYSSCMHVLIHFFDDFAAKVSDFKIKRAYVEKFVYRLLHSDERDERRAALFLLKKLHDQCTDDQMQNFWLTYVTILENLEENQSHLILPTLDSFRQQTVNYPTANLQIWLDMLYIKLLSHQNILVLRWTLDYILYTQSCAELDAKVLLEFVKAINNTSLYNYEGYFLPTENINKFLNNGIERFVEYIAQVNFKCVPLHFWLAHIHGAVCMGESMTVMWSNELILKVATKVRAMQNPLLRMNTIELFERIFHDNISRMRLPEYIVLTEFLYNITDPFLHFDIFYLKLLAFLEDANEDVSLTQRFYEIITNNLYDELKLFHNDDLHNHLKCTDDKTNKSEQQELFNKIVEYIENQENTKEKSSLKWLALMIVFECRNSSVVRKICQCFFHLYLDHLDHDATFEGLSAQIIAKLANGDNTLTFVRDRFADFFAKEILNDFADFKCYLIKAEDILLMGTHKCLLKLSKLLANDSNENKVDTVILDTFLIVLKRYTRMPKLCYKVVNNLLKYLKKFHTTCELVNYANQILCTDLENVGICAAILHSGISLEMEIYIKGILLGETNYGDARTEELYLLKMNKTQCSRLHQIRSLYVSSVPAHLSEAMMHSLLNMTKILSLKKARYFEHSMEHRLKLRMARAIIWLMKFNNEFWNEDLLNVIFNFNNQLNINFIHELLVAKYVPDIEEIILHKFDEIGKYTPSQQVSLMSIIHCYYILNSSSSTPSKDYCVSIVQKLLPLTMGAHFQTRLYAQLIIYKIYDVFNAKRNRGEASPAIEVNLQEAISLAIGPQLQNLLNDVRLLLPHIYLNNSPADVYDILMFITSAPADEYMANLDFSTYGASKRLFAQKKSTFSNQANAAESMDTCSFGANWNNLQRKMNPECELLAMSSFSRQERPSAGVEMIVVANLINKMPNLGGIARTCEVLGIRNLVLSSRKLIEKEAFKIVSMTAEKNLNIIELRPANLQEFLKDKQAEGFKVLGAEQTVDSVNIIDFKFPQKCVLVLGHEKEGIPSNILGFLDHTVEIPQFGLLRSLNVHVTGAMFMWEYCKQHIARSKNLTTTSSSSS